MSSVKVPYLEKEQGNRHTTSNSWIYIRQNERTENFHRNHFLLEREDKAGT